MTTIQRAIALAAEQNISMYRLAQISDVAYSTLQTAVKRDSDLSFDVISRVCRALGITVAEFFSVFT